MGNDEVTRKYIAGKERLRMLLKERDELLAGLDAFTWIQGLSTAEFVVDLDVASLQGLIQALVKLTGEIEELVEETNKEAKRSGQLRVGVKMAERLDPGALRLTKPQNGLAALGE